MMHNDNSSKLPFIKFQQRTPKVSLKDKIGSKSMGHDGGKGRGGGNFQ